MNYNEAREYISSTNQYGSKLGLTAVSELLRRLGNPQDKLKLIHVAGTNGKGSTTAFLTSILTQEGYLVGRYHSPAVFSYLEIIQVGSECISEQGVCDAIEVIKLECDAMLKEGLEHPTTFEIETAMAFVYFLSKKVDYAVIEVGLGGRLDATNVISHPICCVITSISMDHMQYLGETIEQITFEKAGIIKNKVPVVTSNTRGEILRVLQEVCLEKEAELAVPDDSLSEVGYTIKGTSFCYDNQEYEIKLLGEHQIENAILAIRTAQILNQAGYRIHKTNIQKGLLHAAWSGRLEILARDPYFIIDGAHNEDAALKLKASILRIFPNRRYLFIMGVLADKEYQKILKITAPLASVIITVTPDNPRALSSLQLAEEARNYSHGLVIDADRISEAVKIAYQHASQEDIILAFGSLSYLGEVKDSLIQTL